MSYSLLDALRAIPITKADVLTCLSDAQDAIAKAKDEMLPACERVERFDSNCTYTAENIVDGVFPDDFDEQRKLPWCHQVLIALCEAEADIAWAILVMDDAR